MKMTFLGTGSAFTVGDDNFHSNIILHDGFNDRLLIDCGSDARFSLHAEGLSHRDITDVYISHLHADHTGGLEWLAFKSKFDPGQTKKPILHISDQLLEGLWDHDLMAGLQSLHEDVADLSTYFDVRLIGSEQSFVWQSINFQLVQTEHVHNGDALVPSYGLFFLANGLTCFITTDTQFSPDKYMDYYQRADVIFHDCETDAIQSGVHSSYTQLVTLSPGIKEKMWLYHYNPCVLPNAKQDGFRGFVKRGQCFDFNDKESLF